MKKLFIVFMAVVFGHTLHGQSKITLGGGASLSVGAGAAVTAANRDGTMLSSGTFNSRSIVFNPVGTAATSVSGTSFAMNWNPSADANGYKVDVSTDLNFGSFIAGYHDLDVGSVSTWIVNSGISSGTTYYYRVRAYDIDGITGYSNTISLVTAPAPPTATAATGVSDAVFSANWLAAAGATKYYLDVATDNAFSSLVTGWADKDVGNVTSFAVNANITSATTYYYRLRASNAFGTSDNSNQITLLTAPSPPVMNAVSAILQTGFTVNWIAAAGATKYYLDISTNSAFTAGTFVSGYNNLDIGNVTVYAAGTNIVAGTMYYARVRAANTGGTGPNSGNATVTTIPPNPVATAASDLDHASFSANWNVSASATKYFLDVATDLLFTSPVTGWTNVDVGNVVTYPVNTDVLPGTTYYYRIRAYSASGTSGNSNVVSLVTVPPAPVAVAATGAGQTSFTANWIATDGSTKYFLDVSTSSSFSSYVAGWDNLDVGNVTTLSVNSALAAGTTCYYRLRANNAAGTSINSNTVTVTLIPPDPIVSAPSGIATTSFIANWNASLSATGYYLDVATDNTFANMVTGWSNISVGNVLTYSVNTNLAAGTDYYYRVRAANASGVSGNSGTSTLLTAPDVPTALAASVLATTSFQANWSAVVGASGYYLDVSTNTNFDAGTFVTGFENLDVSGVTSFAVAAGLSPGATHYYRVRSYNAGGTSGNSNKVTLMTLPGSPVPSAATSITAGGFTANWINAPGATGYRLDVAVASDFSSLVAGFNDLDVNNVTSYAVSGLTANTPHYYRLRAYNGYGTGGNSGTTTVLTAPAAPTTLAASPVTVNGFTANWNSVPGATGYYLDVSAAVDFSSFVSGWNSLDVGNVTSYLISGLSSSSTYYFRVRAYSTSSPSGNSDVRSVITLPPPPVASTATLVTTTSFAANWSASTSATGYRLDVATDAVFTSLLGSYADIDLGNVLTTSVTGLSAGSSYFYRVRAYNGSGTNGNSNVISVTTVPLAPVELAATAIVSNGFAANWNASAGATGYQLDVSSVNTFAGFVPGFNGLDVGNVLTVPVTGLTAGTTYYYRVRAYNTGGLSGNSGTATPATTGVAPRAPASIPASAIATTSFNANWVAASGATSYRLDVSTASSFASFVTAWQDVDVGNVTTFSVNTNLTAGTAYHYRLRAVNADGTSAPSSTISLVTVPPAPVEQAAAGFNITSFNAEWLAATGATGYRLDVSTAADFSSFVSGYNDLDVSNVTSYTVSGLTASTLYHYRVRGYNTGGTSVSSGTTDATTSIDPGGTVVATPATLIAQTGFNANWNAYGGAVGYRLDVATGAGFGAGTFVTGYQDLDVGNVTTYSVTGLTGGTVYFYRVRAYDGVPATIGNSGTVSLLTLPSDPVATAATSGGEMDFVANWNVSTGATGYYLDVATDAGFTSYVAGFQDKYVNNVITYSVTGLADGTQYFYRVRAMNGSGVSGNSGSVSIFTIPKEPAASAASGVQSSSFDTHWAASTGATRYLLDVSTDPAFGGFVVGWNNTDVGNVTSVSVNTGLSSGTVYYYRVRAANSTGTSGNSGIIPVTTAPAPPTANNASAIGKTSFTANWTGSTGATKYFIDVATTNSFSGGTFATGCQDLDVATATSAVINGLTQGTTYYYRVRAFNSNGTSGNSGTITALTLPSAPEVLPVAVVGETNFTASWNGVASATKYYLDVSTVSNFLTFVPNWHDIDVGAPTSKSVNTDLAAGTTYYFRVRAYNATGLSDNSDVMSTITAPIAPVATAAGSPGETSLVANWNSSAGAAGYLLDVSTVSSFVSFVAGFNQKDVGNVTSYPVTGLTGGMTYYYRVTSYLGTKFSSPSNTITALAVPAAPATTAASSIAGTTLSANWNSATGASGYYLDVATSSSFAAFVPGFNNRDVSSVTTFPVTGLSENTVYCYRVRAYNASGTGTNSNTMSTLTVPAAPTAIAATSVTNITLNANWNPSAAVSGYRLDVSSDPGFGTFVFGFNNRDVANVTTYAVTGLNGGLTYHYRVRAYNASGVGVSSGTITTTTPADPSPAPVALDATALTQSGFAANWNLAATATGYKLDVATDAGFTNYVSGFEDLNVNNVTTYPVTGLASGTTYYFRTRSYNGAGTSSNSNVKSGLTIPANPVPTAAAAFTETSFTANWIASPGALKYFLDVSTDPAFGSFVGVFNDDDVGNVTTLPVTGLSGGTMYYYRVRSNNASGTSGSSTNGSALTRPSAPVVSAASVVTMTSFSANWAAAPGASTYFLDLSTDPAFGSFVTGYDNKDVGNVVTSPAAGLSAYTTYYYRMRAGNASGTGGNSGTMTVVGVPTVNAAASVTVSAFDISWTSVAGATRYYLDVATDSTFTTFFAGYSNRDVGNVTSHPLSGLTIGTMYWFQVRASNATGTSVSSNLRSAVTKTADPVATAASGVLSTSFNANWNAVTGAGGYFLDVAIDSPATTFVAGWENKDVGLVTTYPVSTNILAGSVYYYQVRAYNASGASGSSNMIDVHTLAPVPILNPPTAIAPTSFTINWVPSSGASKYYLDVATDNTFLSFVAGMNNKDVGNVTVYPLSGLTAGNTYYYRLRAFGVSGTSASSAVGSAYLSYSPVLASLEAATLIYTEGATAGLTGTLTVNDFDNVSLVSARIAIINNYKAGEDFLSFADANGISANWDSYNGVLTLSGSSLVANYQAALRSVTYRNSSLNPDLALRTVKFTVFDSTSAGNNVTRDISITPVNDPPAISGVDGTTLVFQEGSAAKVISGSVQIGDPDNLTAINGSVSISANYLPGEDILSFVNASGVSGSWDPQTGILSLSGEASFDQYRAVFASVAYRNISRNPSALQRTISFVVKDGGGATGTASRKIAVVPTNDPPVLSAIETTSLEFVEGGASIAITGALLVSDVDDTLLSSAVVQIIQNYQSGSDVLLYVNGNGIAGSWSESTGTLTLTGGASLAGYQNALRSIAYSNPSANPGSAARTISFRVNDGVNNSNTLSRDIGVTPINNPPVLTSVKDSSLQYSEYSPPLLVADSLVVSDADNTTLRSAVVSLAGNYRTGEDLLAFTDTNGISGNWNLQTGVLTLSGEALVSQYQTALKRITYVNTAHPPGLMLRTVALRVFDGIDSSNVVSRWLKVVHVALPPIVSNIEPDEVSCAVKQEEVQITKTLTVQDLDSPELLSGEVKISNFYMHVEDSLVYIAQNGITGTWEAATGTLRLNGRSSVPSYQAALRSVRYLNRSLTPTALPREVSFSVCDGEGTSAVVKRLVLVSAANVAPVLSGIESGVLKFTPGSAPLIVSKSIAASDSDNKYLCKAEVKFIQGLIPGEDSLAVVPLATMKAQYDGKTGVLTITGQDLVAVYGGLLQSVLYQNNKGSGAHKSLKRISYCVWDGVAWSNAAVRDVDVDGIISAVECLSEEIPKDFVMRQNYPNPFNPSTTLRFGVPVESDVTLTIYDIRGRTVMVLAQSRLRAGSYITTWKAVNLSSGVYYCRMDAIGVGTDRRFTETKKFVLLK